MEAPRLANHTSAKPDWLFPAHNVPQYVSPDWHPTFVDVESDYVHGDKDGLFFTHPEASCIGLEYPAKLEQFPFFARYVASVGYEEQHFDGAML